MGVGGYGKARLKLRPAALAAVMGLAAVVHGAAPAPVEAAQEQRLRTAQSASPARSPAERMLAERIAQLGRDFAGDVGIAVRDVETGFVTAFDGDTFFPQQSVSKFWVAITAFDRADRGMLDLDQRVTLTRSDLTLFHQPIAAQVGANGYTTTIGDLIFRAMTQSDNTCNDFVLRRAGGPEAVREMFQRKGIEGIRFGPGERLLQTRLAGLDGWRPEYSGRAFYAARSSLPLSVRQAAFDRYVADPVDGATPLGVVDALARLQRGELLSRGSTQRLLTIMSQTRTGAQRLRGGLQPGWRLSHKTGTGQVLGSVQTGYNDIGILTAPDGRHYAVAVMIRRTSAPLGTRMALMQNTVRAVIGYSQSEGGGGYSAR
ncbi:MAG: beta-lactamase class [Sphingomonadales bacterium]|nr:beta-lactamase class [Sphingomonadales bacterium]